MILDPLIVLVLLISLWIAFRGGMIQLLLVEVGFFSVWAVFLGHWQGWAHLVEAVHLPGAVSGLPVLVLAIVAGWIGGRVGGLIHRMPAVLGWDGLLGVFAHAFIAILLCYGVISTLVVLGDAIKPGLNGQGLTVAQAQHLRQQLLSNPVLAMLADPADLHQLEPKQARGRADGVRLDQLPSLQQMSLLYGDFAQPQLATSRLAHFVLAVGSRVPGAGQVTPEQLPATPRPSASPSPSPSAPAH
jgi:hypothetical protein